MYIDINVISLCLDLNIFEQDECFCSKLGLEVKHAKLVQSKNISSSDLGDLSLASFCHSRADMCKHCAWFVNKQYHTLIL